MASITTPLVEKLDQKLSSPVKEKLGIKDIWRLKYKRGPIIKEEFFKFLSTGDRKTDRTSAYLLAEKFVKHMAKKENVKCIMIGVPEPFAVDIDEVLKEEATLS